MLIFYYMSFVKTIGQIEGNQSAFTRWGCAAPRPAQALWRRLLKQVKHSRQCAAVGCNRTHRTEFHSDQVDLLNVVFPTKFRYKHMIKKA